MGGIISAGSKSTAQVGADVLASGGNAVSAAVAACFATLSSEPALTSLGGGGIMMMSNRKRRIHKCVNFFSNMPGLTLKPIHKRKHDFHSIALDYLGVKQNISIGKGSAACGDAIHALCEIAKTLGNKPISELTAATIKNLNTGVSLDPSQRQFSEQLVPIYKASKKAKNIFVPENENYNKSYIYSNPDAANFLEGLSDKYWRSFYKTHFYNKVFEEFGPAEGGLITLKDLESFKSLVQEPLVARYKNTRIMLPPKPSGAGELIASALNHLDKVVHKDLHERKLLKYLCYTLHSLSQLRITFPGKSLELLAQQWMMQHFKDSLNRPFSILEKEKQSKSSTTHISVIDDQETAVSITFSHGEGCGHMVGDTGIMMNNFIGEEDHLPTGFNPKLSGQRVPTMIAPTIMETKEGDLYAFGSGGSSRIRSTILQIILNIAERKKDPVEAVSAPRIHVENGVIYSEICRDNKWIQEELSTLQPLGFNPFKEKHLYFGGVNLVKLDAHGKFSGVGDTRRGGACLIVD